MSDVDDATRRARAEERRPRIVITRGRLGDDVDLCPVRGEEAVALVAKLSAAAWSIGKFAQTPERPIDVTALSNAQARC